MAFPVLRRAARLLTPASLQISAGQPRRLSFLADARKLRGEVRLTLSPIAGPPCAGEWAVLDFRLDGQDLTVAGLVVEHQERTLTIAVRRDVTVRPPRRGRVVSAAESLVAVFVPEGTGLGRCCQPVRDIGLRALRLTSSYPFAAGVLLRDLTVLSGTQVLRQAEGTVVQSSPVTLVDGSTSYHCAVRLRAASVLPTTDDPADMVEITEATRVRSILWALCDLCQSVTLRAGPETVRGQLSAVPGSRDALPEVRCALEREATLVGPIQAECTLYGSGYRFYARVLRREGRTLVLAPAPVVREWHRREEERLSLPPEAAGTVTFRHPIGGRRHVRRLSDVSVQGFGFERHAEEDALWPGLPLLDATVTVSGQAVRPARATVRTVGEGRCGVRMEHLSDREADRLRLELMKVSAYPIGFHDGEDLDAILDLHRSARLLEADMALNLEHTLAETRRTWRLAHQHPDGLMRTAFVRWKDRVGAAATVVRAYERSWVFQHLAVASPAVPANPGLLHSTLVRLLVARPDCDCFFTFADEEARSVHTVLRALISELSTPEHRGATPMVLYAGETRRAGHGAAGVRRLRGAEEVMVENAALRLLDPACARALGLRAGEIALRSTAAALRRVGLERGREAWGAFEAGWPTAILVREWASPGLSLSSLLSASLYLPVRPDDRGRAAKALVQVALQRGLPGDPPVRFVFAPAGHDPTPLLDAGLRKVAGCTLYAFGGLSMHAYHRYVATRYGFLHGRLRSRETATT